MLMCNVYSFLIMLNFELMCTYADHTIMYYTQVMKRVG